MLPALPAADRPGSAADLVSTDDDSANTPDAGVGENGNNEKTLDSIAEMYAVLRACWTPPPKDEARRGME